MAVKWLLLCLFSICAADVLDNSKNYRKPSCPDSGPVFACPLNLSPVCGTDGETYGNECLLCAQRLNLKADILIVKDGNC